MRMARMFFRPACSAGRALARWGAATALQGRQRSALRRALEIMSAAGSRLMISRALAGWRAGLAAAQHAAARGEAVADLRRTQYV